MCDLFESAHKKNRQRTDGIVLNWRPKRISKKICVTIFYNTIASIWFIIHTFSIFTTEKIIRIKKRYNKPKQPAIICTNASTQMVALL